MDSPSSHPQVTRAALASAAESAGITGAEATAAVEAFLDRMSDDYVGDTYTEQSLAYLADMVGEVRGEQPDGP
jgi:hypothetical protein